MVLSTIKLTPGANPNVAGRAVVITVLTTQSEQFMVEVASGLLVEFWEATYGLPYSYTIALSAQDFREKAEFLRNQSHLSMNQVFEQFGMLHNCGLSERLLARGGYVVPISPIDNVLKDVLHQRELDNRERCSSPKPKRRSRKSKKERRQRYERRKQKRLAKKRQRK